MSQRPTAMGSDVPSSCATSNAFCGRQQPESGHTHTQGFKHALLRLQTRHSVGSQPYNAVQGAEAKVEHTDEAVRVI